MCIRDRTEIVEMVIPRFRVITVFDVSQTEGEPIADLDVPELTGSVQFYDTFMQALQNISPVPIRMMNVEGEAKGYYHQTEKYIAIQEDMSNVQTMKTGVHEVSHALLHDREVMDAEGVLKDRTTKEVEAEKMCIRDRLYTIMRYLQYDTLMRMGMGHFDSWAATFGETVTAIELSPEGTGYRAKTRFARFFNLPELISILDVYKRQEVMQ